MWWLLGLLVAAAATNSGSTRRPAVRGVVGASDTSSPVLTYRSRDGGSFFRFRFTPLGNDVRVYIIQFPNPDVGSCHVLHDHRGAYICWSGAILSMAAAKAVAAMWAEATLVYQRTRRTF